MAKRTIKQLKPSQIPIDSGFNQDWADVKLSPRGVGLDTINDAQVTQENLELMQFLSSPEYQVEQKKELNNTLKAVLGRNLFTEDNEIDVASSIFSDEEFDLLKPEQKPFAQLFNELYENKGVVYEEDFGAKMLNNSMTNGWYKIATGDDIAGNLGKLKLTENGFNYDGKQLKLSPKETKVLNDFYNIKKGNDRDKSFVEDVAVLAGSLVVDLPLMFLSGQVLGAGMKLLGTVGKASLMVNEGLIGRTINQAAQQAVQFNLMGIPQTIEAVNDGDFGDGLSAIAHNSLMGTIGAATGSFGRELGAKSILKILGDKPALANELGSVAGAFGFGMITEKIAGQSWRDALASGLAFAGTHFTNPNAMKKVFAEQGRSGKAIYVEEWNGKGNPTDFSQSYFIEDKGQLFKIDAKKMMVDGDIVKVSDAPLELTKDYKRYNETSNHVLVTFGQALRNERVSKEAKKLYESWTKDLDADYVKNNRDKLMFIAHNVTGQTIVGRTDKLFSRTKLPESKELNDKIIKLANDWKLPYSDFTKYVLNDLPAYFRNPEEFRSQLEENPLVVKELDGLMKVASEIIIKEAQQRDIKNILNNILPKQRLALPEASGKDFNIDKEMQAESIKRQIEASQLVKGIKLPSSKVVYYDFKGQMLPLEVKGGKAKILGTEIEMDWEVVKDKTKTKQQIKEEVVAKKESAKPKPAEIKPNDTVKFSLEGKDVSAKVTTVAKDDLVVQLEDGKKVSIKKSMVKDAQLTEPTKEGVKDAKQEEMQGQQAVKSTETSTEPQGKEIEPKPIESIAPEKIEAPKSPIESVSEEKLARLSENRETQNAIDNLTLTIKPDVPILSQIRDEKGQLKPEVVARLSELENAASQSADRINASIKESGKKIKAKELVAIGLAQNYTTKDAATIMAIKGIHSDNSTKNEYYIKNLLKNRGIEVKQPAQGVKMSAKSAESAGMSVIEKPKKTTDELQAERLGKEQALLLKASADEQAIKQLLTERRAEGTAEERKVEIDAQISELRKSQREVAKELSKLSEEEFSKSEKDEVITDPVEIEKEIEMLQTLLDRAGLNIPIQRVESITTPEGEQAAGSFVHPTKNILDSFFKMNVRESMRNTGGHEFAELGMKFMGEQDRWNKILDEYKGDKEAVADAFGEYARTHQAVDTSTVFGKLKHFFNTIADFFADKLGWKVKSSYFRRLADGTLSLREPIKENMFATEDNVMYDYYGKNAEYNSMIAKKNIPLKDDEVLIAAALRTNNGKVFTGKNHAEAWDKAYKAGEDFETGVSSNNAGWMTNKREFVSNYEVAKLIGTSRSEWVGTEIRGVDRNGNELDAKGNIIEYKKIPTSTTIDDHAEQLRDISLSIQEYEYNLNRTGKPERLAEKIKSNPFLRTVTGAGDALYKAAFQVRNIADERTKDGALKNPYTHGIYHKLEDVLLKTHHQINTNIEDKAVWDSAKPFLALGVNKDSFVSKFGKYENDVFEGKRDEIVQDVAKGETFDEFINRGAKELGFNEAEKDVFKRLQTLSRNMQDLNRQGFKETLMESAKENLADGLSRTKLETYFGDRLDYSKKDVELYKDANSILSSDTALFDKIATDISESVVPKYYNLYYNSTRPSNPDYYSFTSKKPVDVNGKATTDPTKFDHFEYVNGYGKDKKEAMEQVNKFGAEGYAVETFDRIGDIISKEQFDRLTANQLMNLVSLGHIEASNPVIQSLLRATKTGNYEQHSVKKRYIKGMHYTPEEFEHQAVRLINEAVSSSTRKHGLGLIRGEIASNRAQVNDLLKSTVMGQADKDRIKRDFDYSTQIYNQVAHSDQSFIDAWRQGATAYYVGMKPSFWFQQMMQPLQTTLPEAISQVRGTSLNGSKVWTDSFKKAFDLAIHLNAERKGETTNLVEQEFLDAYHKLDSQGLMGAVGMEELTGKGKDIDMRYGDAKHKIWRSFIKIANLGGAAAEKFTRLHSLATFYEIGKAKGLTGAKLEEYLINNVKNVMGGWGALDRPAVFQSKQLGKSEQKVLKAIDKAFFTFKTYANTNLGQYDRLFRNKQYGALGTKALIGVGMHGITKFPLAATVFALANLFTEDDSEYEVLKALDELDGKIGGNFGSILAKGLPSQSSINMQNLFDERSGFATDVYAETRSRSTEGKLAEAMFGAPYGLSKDLVDSASGVHKLLANNIKNDYTMTDEEKDRALKNLTKATPLFFRNIFNAMNLKKDGVELQNKTLVKSDDISWGDVVFKAIGFNPSTVADAYEYQLNGTPAKLARAKGKQIELKKIRKETTDPAELRKISELLRSAQKEEAILTKQLASEKRAQILTK